MSDLPLDLASVVAEGDARRSLQAIRDHLAARLLSAKSQMAVAPIAKQLCDVIGQLEALADPERTDAVDDLTDELAKRRADREKATG